MDRETINITGKLSVMAREALDKCYDQNIERQDLIEAVATSDALARLLQGVEPSVSKSLLRSAQIIRKSNSLYLGQGMTQAELEMYRDQYYKTMSI